MDNELTCRRFLDVIGPQDSALAAAQLMRQRGIGCLVVVDHDRAPIGILTDRDLALRIVAEGRDADITEVEEVMTERPFTLQEDNSLDDALKVMQHAAIRRLPIVSTEGQLVGLVTLDDLMLSMTGEMRRVGDLLRTAIAEAAATGRESAKPCDPSSAQQILARAR